MAIGILDLEVFADDSCAFDFLDRGTDIVEVVVDLFGFDERLPGGLVSIFDRFHSVEIGEWIP
jgi:hypothetical protein